MINARRLEKEYEMSEKGECYFENLQRDMIIYIVDQGSQYNYVCVLNGIVTKETCQMIDEQLGHREVKDQIYLLAQEGQLRECK